MAEKLVPMIFRGSPLTNSQPATRLRKPVVQMVTGKSLMSLHGDFQLALEERDNLMDSFIGLLRTLRYLQPALLGGLVVFALIPPIFGLWTGGQCGQSGSRHSRAHY